MKNSTSPSADKQLRPLVMSLIRPYYRGLAIVLLAMMVEMAMTIAAPWPLKIIIDHALGKRPLPEALHWLNDLSLAHTAMGVAALAAIGYVLIALISGIATYIDNYYSESVGQWVANDLRLRIYHHLQRLSLGYYDTHQSGSILSTMTNDVSTVQSFASGTTLSILVDLMTIVGMLAVMFWMDWDFALIAVAVTPFLLFFVSRFKKAVKEASREVRLKQSDVMSVVQQGVESIRVIEAFGQEQREEERLAKASAETVQAALAARKVKSLLGPIISLIVAACTAFVMWRSASLIINDQMSVGELTVFLAYLSKFFNPVKDLAKMTNTIAMTTVSLERIQDILEADTGIAERPGAQPPQTLQGAIRFEGVHFAYTPDAKVLHGVDFQIEPGQKIGIVGATGGGKSTVVSLIPRFYDPTEGRVLIDGTDIRDFTLEGLRKEISFVLQDTALFQGTIRDNIAYGKPDATDDEIIAAAREANAHEFITRMPHGYDTHVGERGMTMSGGQRQRIGIARAIIRNTPILILDEPTAALDTESERLVVEALNRLTAGRTVLTIAHRLSTIRDSDAIIVLKEGRVAEMGSHAELLARQGLYAELYHVQFPSDAPTPNAE